MRCGRSDIASANYRYLISRAHLLSPFESVFSNAQEKFSLEIHFLLILNLAVLELRFEITSDV